jgi:hypothetical protein
MIIPSLICSRISLTLPQKHNLTAQALIQRETPARRPFVLSRSFYAGSQRYGPIWQGDNQGTWEHLAVSVPMILSNGIAGMAWNGGAICAFNTSHTSELNCNAGQPTSAVSLGTHPPKCWSAGTSQGHSTRSSAPTRTLTPSVANPTSSTSPFAVTFEMPSGSAIRCCQPGTRLSGRRASLVSL